MISYWMESSGREQGKRWYDVDVWRNFREISNHDLVDICVDAGYSRTYLPQAIQEAIRKGDLVKITAGTAIGAGTLLKREEEERKREEEMDRQCREMEERRRIREEKSRIEKEETDRIRTERIVAETDDRQARINASKRAGEVEREQAELELSPLRGQEKEIGEFLRNLGLQNARDLDGIREMYGIGFIAARRLAEWAVKFGNVKRVVDEEIGIITGYHDSDAPELCVSGS